MESIFRFELCNSNDFHAIKQFIGVKCHILFIPLWCKCVEEKKIDFMKQINSLTIFFLFFFHEIASAIKCWRCSSDASNAAFCNDPFDASIISDQQRRWSYVECTYPPGQLNPYSQASNQRAVCKKDIKLGKSIHSFKQYFININYLA